MRTRTHLTTPAGQEPELSAAPADEPYVPGLRLPEEPRVPGRHRRLWLTVAIVALVALAGYGVLLSMTAGQSFDPALDTGVVPDDATGGTGAPSPVEGQPGE